MVASVGFKNLLERDTHTTSGKIIEKGLKEAAFTRCDVSHGGIKAVIGNGVLLSQNCYDLPGQLFPSKGLFFFFK